MIKPVVKIVAGSTEAWTNSDLLGLAVVGNVDHMMKNKSDQDFLLASVSLVTLQGQVVVSG